MSEANSILQQYNIVNCVVDDKASNALEQALTEDMINREEPVFYVQHGQYIIPVSSNSFEENDANEYFITTADEKEDDDEERPIDSVIYCTPEQFAQYTQLHDNGEPVITGIVVEVDKEPTQENLIDADASDNMLALENNNELNSDMELPYEGHLQDFTYAILKNGQLHLKTNIEDKEKLYLKEKLDALQASIDFDSSCSKTTIKKTINLDSSEVTGKDLITGQTVKLKKYMQKALSDLPQPTYVNKRMLLGKTSNGKMLVAKILHIEKGSPHKDQCKSSKAKTKEEKMDLTTKTFIINTVGNVLVELMNLQDISLSLRNKKLAIKLYRKVCCIESAKFIQRVFLIRGYMESVEDKWQFNGTHVDDFENFKEKDQECQKSCNTTQNIPDSIPEASDPNTVYFSITLLINRDGKMITEVQFDNPLLCNQVVHVDNQIFGCDECIKTFSDETMLYEHKKSHHLLRWSNTVCSICNKKFMSAGSLKRHFTTHNPAVRPLQCYICLQRFTEELSLKTHMQIHTGLQAVVCKICNQTFLNQSEFIIHNGIHHPAKLFECDICGRGFSRQSHLLRHEQIHRSTSAVYKCQICRSTYGFASSLTRHLVNNHLNSLKEPLKTESFRWRY